MVDVRNRFGKVLIIPHVRKAGIREMVKRVSGWLKKNDIEFCLLDDDVMSLGLDLPSTWREGLDGVGLAIALGGDGTMLHAVDLLWKKGVPLVGINIGKMGFLTAAESHQAEEALAAIFSGQYLMSQRIPVGCRLTCGTEHSEYRALNEIVVGKHVRERLIRLLTNVNGEFFMHYSGDGLIFSSSTGSTAYSLSAGGPIVTPDLECLVMTPICAHMLFSRPMVLDASDTVTVTVDGEPERLSLRVDGRLDIEVPMGASVEFYALRTRVKIIELVGTSFYGTVRRKFMSTRLHEEYL
jgi:NAD+ kinase